MRSIQIILAHPKLEHSVVNQSLLTAIKDLDHVFINDLYEKYPDFNVNVATEKSLLLKYDVHVMQHPFYWYSCPPLLKQWIDLVLEFGWAYGIGGDALQGKFIFNAISSGGDENAYRHDGRNRFTIEEFLRPFEQTAHLCKMSYLKPFAVQGTHKISKGDLEHKCDAYRSLLQNLRDEKL